MPRILSSLRVPMAALGALLLGACARAQAAPGTATGAASPAASVRTVEVLPRSFPRSLRLTGSLAPNQSSSIASDGAGKVIRTFVERGTRVNRGDPLVQLDASEVTLAAAEARAGADNARTQDRQAQLECERAEQLLARQVISPAAYQQARAGCDSSNAGVAAARARAARASQKVGDSWIRAPFAGEVVERLVAVGEYVGPGTRIARIIQVNPMRVELSVPEAASGQLHEGQSLGFTVAAVPGDTFAATVRYIAPAIEDRSRNLVVEALVDRPDPRLKPGMFVTTRLLVGRESALAIPTNALGGDPTTPRVWVKVGGHVEERVISLGDRDGSTVAVKQGLAKGERVVVDPGADLRDGLAVREVGHAMAG